MSRKLALLVNPAAAGGKALAAVERSTPDLVVLDVGLPGVDGLSVSRRLRANSTSQRTASVLARGLGTSTGTW